MKFGLILFLMLFLAKLSYSQDDEKLPVQLYNPEQIEKFLKDSSIDDKTKFIKELRKAWKGDPIIMTRSESGQHADCENPRLILPVSHDLVFAVSTKKKEGKYVDPSVEMIVFKNDTENHGGHFQFHNLFSEGKVFTKNDVSCTGCHKNRPNWDSYPTWPGQLRFLATVNSSNFMGTEEKRAWERLKKQLANDPIFALLEPSAPGDGAQFFDRMSAQNAKRIASDIRSIEKNKLASVKHALLGLVSGCIKTAADLKRFVPDKTFSEYAAFQKINSFEELVQNVKERNEIQKKEKEKLTREYLHELIGCNIKYYKEDIPKDKLATEIERRVDAEIASFRKIFPEFELQIKDYEQMFVPGFRFLLEPLGIKVNEWSMAPLRQSENFGFGDRINNYVSSVRLALGNGKEEAIESECAEWAKLSRQAYEHAANQPSKRTTNPNRFMRGRTAPTDPNVPEFH